MDTKDLGVMLGGVAAVMGLAYARSKMSGSLAEFSTIRGKLAERELKSFGNKAEHHNYIYQELVKAFHRSGGAINVSTDSIHERLQESRTPLRKAYEDLQQVLAEATRAEKEEIYQKLPDLARVPPKEYIEAVHRESNPMAERWLMEPAAEFWLKKGRQRRVAQEP